MSARMFAAVVAGCLTAAVALGWLIYQDARHAPLKDFVAECAREGLQVAWEDAADPAALCYDPRTGQIKRAMTSDS